MGAGGAQGGASSADAAGNAGDAGGAGAPVIAPPLPPRDQVWLIGGQSNGTGQGIYTGNVNPEPLVHYFVNGIARSLIPSVGAIHGLELGLALALARQGAPVWINKTTADGQTCNFLLTDPNMWAADLAGIKVIARPGASSHFVWVQGEADAGQGTTQAAYEGCLRAMIAKVRAAFASTVRVHVLLLNAAVASRYGQTGVDIVRAAQRAVVASDGNADIVSMDDSPPNNGVHYDSDQLIDMGQRFAALAGG